MKKILGSLFLALQTTFALAQVKAEPANSWQTIFFDSPTVALPILTAAALEHSPQLKSLEINKSINQEDIKLAKRNILSGVGLVGNYTYGNQGNIGPYDPQNPNTGTNGANTGRYAVGVGLGLPILQVISRGGLIKKEQLNYQRSELARQQQEEQMRQQIIQLYQNVVLSKKLLTLQQEAYVTIQTNYRLAEKQFRQGQMSLTELSETSNQLTQSAMAQETARNQYETSFMLLEEIVGAKIPSLMKTQ